MPDTARQPRPDPAGHNLRLEVESTADAPAEARMGLLPLVEELPSEAYSDLKLIVSELVTNSVRYGPGAPISISLVFDAPKMVSGMVTDGGTGGVVVRSDVGPDGEGLGLIIVDTLASSWGVRSGSSEVWFELAGSTSAN